MSHESAPGAGGQAASQHIPSLDGIRAISVLLVVMTHSGFSFASGALGVNVFFFLSGFLITTLLRREHRRTGRINFRRFYLRRALRIFPPMYLLLAVAVALSVRGWLEPMVTRDVAVAQFFHLSNYAHISGSQVAPGTEILWSLSVEEHFYLVFPALFAFLMARSPRQRFVILVLICVSVLTWRCWVVAADFMGGARWAYEATDTRMDSILWGAVFALFANPYFEPERAKHLDRVSLGVLAVGVILASQAYKAEWFSHTLRYTLQCVCFAPLFVLAIHRAHRFPMSLLDRQPLRWIGEISYGLYLYRYLVIAILVQHTTFSGLALLTATLAISLPICALSERYLERPAAVLRKRFAS